MIETTEIEKRAAQHSRIACAARTTGAASLELLVELGR